MTFRESVLPPGGPSARMAPGRIKRDLKKGEKKEKEKEKKRRKEK